jgi:hypothetical protein
MLPWSHDHGQVIVPACSAGCRLWPPRRPSLKSENNIKTDSARLDLARVDSRNAFLVLSTKKSLGSDQPSHVSARLDYLVVDNVRFMF